MSSKQKFWLILLVLLLTCLYSWIKPRVTIYSSSDVLIVDRVLDAIIWSSSCWLCGVIMKNKKDERL